MHAANDNYLWLIVKILLNTSTLSVICILATLLGMNEIDLIKMSKPGNLVPNKQLQYRVFLQNSKAQLSLQFTSKLSFGILKDT